MPGPRPLPALTRLCNAALLGALATAAPALRADPVPVTVLHGFTGSAGDAAMPGSAPTLGTDGNFYGVTPQGGLNQMGAIYQTLPDGSTHTLFSFPQDGSAGVRPVQHLVRDAHNNFYGMANGGPAGAHGVVFKVTPSGQYTVLHAFAADGTEGTVLDNGLVMGADGALYGVASCGGATYPWACGGTFFRIRTDGTQFSVRYNFPPGADGQAATPQARLAKGADGNFYGIAASYYSGSTPGYGALYRITPAGVATTLTGFTDGHLEAPTGTPQIDSAGLIHFFGSARDSSMWGRVYRFDLSTGVLSTLHQFNGADGVVGGSDQLLLGQDGRLYGVAIHGGSHSAGFGSEPYGTVFSLGLDGSFNLLHDFGAPQDAADPQGAVFTAKDGSLWGTSTTSTIQSTPGTIYRMTPPTETLTVRPKSITVGQKATLTWSSTASTDCAATGAWVAGALNTSGSTTVVPGAVGTYYYTMTCTGAGSVVRTVSLTVH